MKLPEINFDDLPDEVKALVEGGAEFDSIVDGNIAIDFPIGPEEHKKMKIDSARKLVLHRRWVEEMEVLYKRYESGKITREEAERLAKEATDRKKEGRFS
tara:strand:- start:127 stop:426 length:300 start_codon:yes stop_codon:yes gene_type:complete